MPDLFVTRDPELVQFLGGLGIEWREWQLDSIEPGDEEFRYIDGAGLRAALAAFRGEFISKPSTQRLVNPKIVTLAELVGTLFADRNAA